MSERRERYEAAVKSVLPMTSGVARSVVADAAMEIADAELATQRGEWVVDIARAWEEADRLRSESESANFHLGQEMARRQLAEKTLARVRAVADAIDTEMRTEPDTQRAAMQHEAVIRINAALNEKDPHA